MRFAAAWIAVVAVLAASEPSRAVENCSAKVDTKTGVIDPMLQRATRRERCAR